jgi:hypothetical protein
MVVEYALLDLYHVFVEVLFGHFILALIGITAIFAILCFMFRMSMFLAIIISFLFLFIMIMGYLGSIAGVFMFFFSATYFAYSLVRWTQGYLAS